MAGLRLPHQVESQHAGVLVLDVIGWEFARPLFALIPPVRPLAHLDDVPVTGAFAR